MVFFNFTLTKIIKYWSLFWIIICFSIYTQKALEVSAAGVNWRDVFFFLKGLFLISCRDLYYASLWELNLALLCVYGCSYPWSNLIILSFGVQESYLLLFLAGWEHFEWHVRPELSGPCCAQAAGSETGDSCTEKLAEIGGLVGQRFICWEQNGSLDPAGKGSAGR